MQRLYINQDLVYKGTLIDIENYLNGNAKLTFSRLKKALMTDRIQLIIPIYSDSSYTSSLGMKKILDNLTDNSNKGPPQRTKSIGGVWLFYEIG